MAEKILVLIFCHMIGDYVLQTDFIAKTKGENLWHMVVHCTLYILPFYLAFGVDWRISFVWMHHYITDVFKARTKLIGYATDQLSHIAMLGLWL